MADHPLDVDATPTVTVVMPVRDEASFIGRSLGAVLDQDYPPHRMDVVVVDGMSGDGTRAAIAETVAARPSWAGRVQVLDNPSRVTPSALNIGLRAATGDLFVRVDGHCEIAPDYVRRVVEALAATGAECVGGVCETVGESTVARAIAVAQSSPFGVGNVAFRVRRAEAGPVDTVPFGAYPRAVVEGLGGWDEELVRNQDDELNFRLVQRGGAVWYDPSIRSRYHSRSDLRRLWRQYFEYGQFKVRVMQKRGGLASPRQAVPAITVAGLGGAALASLATRRARWLLAAALPYAGTNAVVAVRLARRRQVPAHQLSSAFAVLHFGYGLGFLSGLWRWRAGFARRRAGHGL